MGMGMQIKRHFRGCPQFSILTSNSSVKAIIIVKIEGLDVQKLFRV